MLQIREGAFEPEDIRRMSAAYEAPLKLLRLHDRAGPSIEIVAKKITRPDGLTHFFWYADTPNPLTLGNMRANGVRSLALRCLGCGCAHHDVFDGS